MSEEEKIKSLLQLSESIETKFIPGTAENLDKKTFNWTLTQLDENLLKMEFLFDYPIYISAGDLEDKIKITF